MTGINKIVNLIKGSICNFEPLHNAPEIKENHKITRNGIIQLKKMQDPQPCLANH